METIIENYAIAVIKSQLGYVTKLEKNLSISEIRYRPYIKLSDERVLKFSRDEAIRIIKSQSFLYFSEYRIVNHLGKQEKINI